MKVTRRFVSLALVSPVIFHAAPAAAQDQWPSKPLRMIVPFTSGSASDVTGRIVAQRLAEMYGQQVVVDNRPGAGGRPRAVNRVPACGMRTSASRDARRWI